MLVRPFCTVIALFGQGFPLSIQLNSRLLKIAQYLVFNRFVEGAENLSRVIDDQAEFKFRTGAVLIFRSDAPSSRLVSGDR